MAERIEIFHNSESGWDRREREMREDHLSVEIEDTDGQDLSGLQATNKSANQIPGLQATIFKVNAGLHESNPAAYTPKLISIGPYHNKSPKFRSMEKYKLLYLQRFLHRKEGIDEKSCMRELENLKNKALMCYDDSENFDRDIIDKFSKIMLLDGCFVVEFVRERYGYPQRAEGSQKVIYKSWMKSQVCRDLVVLENQLPFFVLTMLYDMTKCPDEENFLCVVRRTLLSISPKVTYKSESVINRLIAEPFDHLPHVLHVVSCPSGMINSRQCPDGSNLWNSYFIPNATELYEAGVSFKKIGSVEEDVKDTANLLDINFEKGLLEIPCFIVRDYTETFIRNLIAFEQHSNAKPYFSHYARIMSQLINSHKDVHLLREGGIILDRLGDDKAVANIFNKLGDGVALSENFHYKEVCSKLNQHCQKPRNKKMANLRHNYFQSPWAGASTVGAIILLILTTIQTVLAFTGSVK